MQDMLDKAESFFGKKQKLKLQYKGKTATRLRVGFREFQRLSEPLEGFDGLGFSGLRV